MQHINHLKSVAALARHGHFGRAAESIGLTQSALSQNIHRIEALYGVSLFVRQRGRVTPTAYGEIVIAAALTGIEALERAQREIQLLQNLETGHLVVGVAPYLASSILGPALSSLMEAYPKLKFTLTLAHWPRSMTSCIAVRGRRILSPAAETLSQFYSDFASYELSRIGAPA